MRELIDLVLPRSCAGCGEPGELLCAACAPPDGLIPVRGAVPALAAARYGGGVRRALLAYKERGRRDLVGCLAGFLLAPVRGVAGGQPGAVLVPVPSTRAAARARGGDHVLRLARGAAARADLPVCRALRLVRRVSDSAGLSSVERARNVHGALRAQAPPPGCAAVLVDDIVTTGATLAEAGRALRAAGWPVLGAAVVAATPRRPVGDTDGQGLCSSGNGGR